MKGLREGRGYSLLEALIVVVLIGAILAVSIPMLFRFLQVYRIQTGAQQIAVNLRFARNAALKQKREFRVVIFDESSSPPNTYRVLHDQNSDGTFDIYKHANTSLPSALTILTGGLSTVTFDARGAATPSGNVTLKGTDLSEYRVTVTLAGGVTIVKTVEGIY